MEKTGCAARRVGRGDRHVEDVDQGALLARQLGEGVAVGDDQLNAADDTSKRPCLPARATRGLHCQ
jgi:hypothetical protein